MGEVEMELVARRRGQRGFAARAVGKFQLRRIGLQIAAQNSAKEPASRDESAAIAIEMEAGGAGLLIRGKRGRERGQTRGGKIEWSGPKVDVHAGQRRKGGWRRPGNIEFRHGAKYCVSKIR